VNLPFKAPIQKTPDIYLSGEAVDQVLFSLNNAIIFAKSQDGSMRPFIDPTPITQIIMGAIQEALKPMESENTQGGASVN
jgi:hypothetical protein